MGILLAYILLFGYDPSAAEGQNWNAVSKTVIEVGPTTEFELEIKTYSSLGSGDNLGLSLYSSQGHNKSGEFGILLTSTPQYYLYCCQYDYDFPHTIPSALEDLEEYIWKISLNKTSSKLKIQCNEFELLAMQLSDENCTSSCWSTEGKEAWGRDMKDIYFLSIDTASDYYRLNSLDDWTAVGLVKPEINLETLGLEIKSHSILGSKDRIEVYFLSVEDTFAGGFEINYSNSSFYLKWCFSSAFEFPVALPTAEVTIWRIGLKRYYDDFQMMSVYCNDVPVVKFVFPTDRLCSRSSYRKDIWSRLAEKIYFGYTDTASNYYRPYLPIPDFLLKDSSGNIVGAETEGLLITNGGTVCDNGFSDNSADAICREMGYFSHTSWTSGNKWQIQSELDIKLSNVSCEDGYWKWSSCTFSISHNCSHAEDIFLRCKDFDWVTPQYRVRYSLLQDVTLELKTTTNLLEKRIGVYFSSNPHETSPSYFLIFKCTDLSSSSWSFTINGCTTGWIAVSGVPREEIKVWQITRTSTSLIIVCNGVTVFNFNFATDYMDGYSSCHEIWGKFTTIQFYSSWLMYDDSSHLFMRIAKDGWITPQHQVSYGLFVNETLQLKTTANLLEERIILRFNFMSEAEQIEGSYSLYFECTKVSSRTWVFAVEGCMDNYWNSPLPMDGVSSDPIKVWQITRYSTSLVIVCNGVTVLNFNFDPDYTYRDGDRSCHEIWGQSTATQFQIPRWGKYGDGSHLFMKIDRCKELDTTWEKMETSPALPVNHGDTIQLSCQTGYSLAGSDSATCIHGVSTVQISPVCFVVEAKNSEVLVNTQTTISCVISGLTKEVDGVEWEKPNSGGVIYHGTDGYQIDKGTFDTETNSQTTVLTIPADKNTADSVYTCVIRSVEDKIMAKETVISDVFKITPQDTTQTVMALNQTLYCTIKDAPYPVHVIWKDNDFNEITNSTEGYSIHQGTVNDNNTQTSTLSISAAKLREMDTSSPLTWRCSAQSLRFQESDPSADFNVVILFLPFEVEAKNSEVLMNTQTTISCVISGLSKELDEVQWEKPNSGGVIYHGTGGYQIDKGTFDSETNSQTTVLTIPADKNTADSVYTCVITSVEHEKMAKETVISDVFTITTVNVSISSTTEFDAIDLKCLIGNLTEVVQVEWEDYDTNTITANTGGYSIDQGTVDNNYVQASTLKVSAKRLKTAIEKGLHIIWACKVQSIKFPQSRRERKELIVKYLLIEPTLSSFDFESGQIFSHHERTGLLMMTFTKESTDEFGVRSQETQNATVCAEDFNFGMADYVCSSINRNYSISQQWGRTGDTDQYHEQEKSLDTQEYNILKCRFVEERYIDCQIDDNLCQHNNDIWLSCDIDDSSTDSKRWRDDGKCGAEFPLRDGRPSECDPKGINPCCNEHAEQSDCGNTEDYCTCRECRDYRPINNRKCEISEEGGFLKYKCFNQQLQEHFKCARSDNDTINRYKPNVTTWVDSRGVFMITSTDKVCKNDPYAYQACGFGTAITIEPTLCGGNFNDDDGNFNGHEKGTNISGECDSKCDIRYTCKDESNCAGHFYGLKCLRLNKLDYVPVHWICNDVAGCDENLDEQYCALSPERENCTHYYAEAILGKTVTVPINNFTRCAIFDISKGIYPYCSDFLDQANCTDASRIGGICKRGNKPISVSKSMVCYNHNSKSPLCEDGSENFCRTLVSSNSEDDECKVHKHMMCDERQNCKDGRDEQNDICNLMAGNFRCKRKFSRYQENNRIPLSWLLDNEVDCINGEDEETSKWRECFGNFGRDRYVIPQNERCKDLFICNLSNTSVRLDIMCDGVESCGLKHGVENEVCRFSRDFPDIKKIAPYTILGPTSDETDLCTDIIDTRRNSCEKKEFPPDDKMKTFGVTKILNLPKVKVNCDDKFGEFYVYLSCMDRCKNGSVKCPLGNTSTPLSYDACPGQYPDRIYTLAGEKNLTFVTKSNGKGYQNNYFQCADKRCIEYSQVCDLTNDCGDWSDEKNCTNSVLCSNEKSRISLKQQCDGIIDCVDLSDECNAKCGKRILEYWSLRGICWIMGILATTFNVVLIIRTGYSMKSIRTGSMLETKILIVTIATGDLLNGLYLITIAVYDTIVYGNQYCQEQAKWLSSGTCSVLGVMSTMGSQMSLFAMTALSIVRVIGLTRKSIKAPSPVNKTTILVSSVKVAIILAMSATIALIPLVPQLEDYFVQGIYYESENNVFMGFPNKERHVNVLKAYFGEDLNTSYDMAWKDIHGNMSQMFTNEHETMSWRKVHYYGNDGLCLFKYFVRNDDARRSRQTFQVKTGVLDYINFEGNGLLWVVLSVNFVCFLVMSISYVRITIQTWKSSSSSGQNSNLQNVRRKERIELKITLIIVTDFLCWIPFIIVCAFHNFQFIDATEWYAYFAMVLLSVNSVLNPLLYDNTITDFLMSATNRVSTGLSSLVSCTQAQSTASETLAQHGHREAIVLENVDEKSNQSVQKDKKPSC